MSGGGAQVTQADGERWQEYRNAGIRIVKDNFHVGGHDRLACALMQELGAFVGAQCAKCVAEDKADGCAHARMHAQHSTQRNHAREWV